MPSTSAVVFFKPTMADLTAANHSTPAWLLIPLRFVAGPFAAAGVTASLNLKNLKAWLPAQRVAVVDENGLMTPSWYRFIHYVVEVVLGGSQGSTIPDITTSVTYSEAQSLAQSIVTAALKQQALANAQSLAAAVQVVQMASLPGSAQIPTVVLSPPETGGGD